MDLSKYGSVPLKAEQIVQFEFLTKLKLEVIKGKLEYISPEESEGAPTKGELKKEVVIEVVPTTKVSKKKVATPKTVPQKKVSGKRKSLRIFTLGPKNVKPPLFLDIMEKEGV